VDNEGPRKNDIIINIIYLLEETLEKNSNDDEMMMMIMSRTERHKVL